MSLIGKKILKKRLRQWKKYPWAESGIYVFAYERERKRNNIFQFTVIIFKAYKKCKSPIQKGFYKCRTSNQNIFFSSFRDHLKNGEGSKGDAESICARVTKHVSKKVTKAEVNLNWLWTIDYGLFWLYIYLYIHGQFSLFDTNVLAGFMISLFLAGPVPRACTKNMKSNGNISTEWAKVLSFV